MSKLLLVVDMQNDFVFGSLGSEEAKAIVDNVYKKVTQYIDSRSDNYILFTRDTHQENYLQTAEGRHLPVEHCIEGTPGWQIVDALDSFSEISDVFDKPNFGSVQLAEYIKTQYNVDEIEIVGLCTDICVVSNALILKAVLPDIDISVDAACCAGVTPETHSAALATMKMCQINIK